MKRNDINRNMYDVANLLHLGFQVVILQKDLCELEEKCDFNKNDLIIYNVYDVDDIAYIREKQ